MTEPRKKLEKLSETAKKRCTIEYIAAVHGRRQSIDSKFLSKGLQAEEDSITLFSRVSKIFLQKNEKTISNQYLVGTPDTYIGGESIEKAETIVDVKTSWDIFTFYSVLNAKTNPIYYWQLQAYMVLTGAANSILAYCLVNTPEPLILNDKIKLGYKFGIDYMENPAYQFAAEQIEANAKYDDIPMQERIIAIEVARDDNAIAKLYERIEMAREYMAEIHSMRQSTFNPIQP